MRYELGNIVCFKDILDRHWDSRVWDCSNLRGATGGGNQNDHGGPWLDFSQKCGSEVMQSNLNPTAMYWIGMEPDIDNGELLMDEKLWTTTDSDGWFYDENNAQSGDYQN